MNKTDLGAVVAVKSIRIIQVFSLSMLMQVSFAGLPVMAAAPITSVMQAPSGEWAVQIAAHGQACNISNTFGSAASIRIHAANGALKSLFLRLQGASFEKAQAYTLHVNPLKGAGVALEARALSAQDLVIKLEEGDNLLGIISSSPVIRVGVNAQNYVLSLAGLTTALPKLLACDENPSTSSVVASVASQPEQVDAAHAPTKKVAAERLVAPAVESSTPAATPETTPPQDELIEQKIQPEIKSEPVQKAAGLTINPFPLDPQKNKAALNAAKLDTEPALSNTVQVTPDEPQEKLPEVKDAVVGAALPVRPQVQSKVMIEPSDKKLPQLQVPEPQQQNDVFNPASLVRPPVMDLPLPSLEGATADENNTDNNLSDAAVSAPDGVIVNHEAQLYVTAAQDERVMMKNDIEAEAKAFARPMRRDEPGLLSQSHEMASVEPIIIPRVPESTLPTRFDLMNRGEPVQDGSKTQGEPTRQVRDVSNEMLEQQMKSILQVEHKEQSPKTAAVENKAPVVEAKAESQPADEPEKPAVNAAAPVAKSAAQMSWYAFAGSDLRAIIANWSAKEGVELVWNTQDNYKIKSDFSSDKGYEQAVASLLNQYSDAAEQDIRPAGELYIDPASGKRILIIQSTQ